MHALNISCDNAIDDVGLNACELTVHLAHMRQHCSGTTSRVDLPARTCEYYTVQVEGISGRGSSCPVEVDWLTLETAILPSREEQVLRELLV